VDTSALIKRYLAEAGTSEVLELLSRASLSGTAAITRAETAGVFSRALSRGLLTQEQLERKIGEFRNDWPGYLRFRISERVIRDADYLAIQYSLRGYDAVHLASALVWKERISDPITFATFDDTLWRTAGKEGFGIFPASLPSEFLRDK
jgi:predicted nucleic acid-binding protein